jgi:serine/arginine repetitive matrix protein 2
MRPGPNVSPLKLALHRKQVEVPAKQIITKKSSHNIFAPAVKVSTPLVQTDQADIDKSATLLARSNVQRTGNSDEIAACTIKIPYPPVVAAPLAGLPPPPRPARRNIFAPPSPQVTAHRLASLDFSDETVGMPKRRPMSGASAFNDRVEHDVPQDLRDLFANVDFTSSAMASPIAGLPQIPSSDRRPTSARRRRNPHSAALPSSPLSPDHQDEWSQPSVAQVPHSPPMESARGSMLSEFNFEYEVAKLNKGTHRASFVEALQKAKDNCSQSSHDMPPLPPLPAPPARYDNFRNSQFEDACSERGSSTSTVIVAAAARRSPFMGTFAFQQHASTINGSHSPPTEEPLEQEQVPDIEIHDVSQFTQDEAEDEGRFEHASEEDMTDLVPPPQRRYHKRDESGVSIATMSSIGEVIETGVAADYTNYFDVQFAKELSKAAAPPATEAPTHSRQSSVASTASAHGHRRGHSRHTSIASLASIDGLEHALGFAPGPPISLHNRKRSSYISKHRQSGSSFEAAFGRSDWAAAHRRNSSDDSVMSNLSASRICRPGLGDRMFQLDGGVQLTSITASPLDHADNEAESSESEVEDSEQGHTTYNTSKATYYTAYDGEASFHTALDTSLSGRDSVSGGTSSEDQHKARPISTSSTASSVQSSPGESIFGPNTTGYKGNFLLRPISAITTDSSSNEEDTFVNVVRGQGLAMKPSCIEAHGEETMSMSMVSSSSETVLTFSSGQFSSTA